MSVEEYREYTNKVYEALLQLPIGKFYSVEKMAKPENISRFIKICCMFILSNPGYAMSDDYSQIKHLQ